MFCVQLDMQCCHYKLKDCYRHWPGGTLLHLFPGGSGGKENNNTDRFLESKFDKWGKGEGLNQQKHFCRNFQCLYYFYFYIIKKNKLFETFFIIRIIRSFNMRLKSSTRHVILVLNPFELIWRKPFGFFCIFKCRNWRPHSPKLTPSIRNGQVSYK